MLTIRNLTYRIDGRTLLENASLSIPAKRKVGLVGQNGTGKSTLFKLIAGELSSDGGDITLVNKAVLGMVRQDLPEDETTLVDVVLNSDKERAALFKEAETAEDPERIGYIYSRLEEINAYDAPSRASIILSGLGFNEKAQNSPISSFSGGWRMRVALASALFLEPDLLMLDEPTNHLDFEAMVWLENYLMRYNKTLIIISHDRDILNKTVDHIVHIDNCQLVSYTGNYNQFERRRAEKMINQQALHKKQTAQKEHMMKFVERFRAKASKARQAQSRLKAIEKMDIVDAVIAERVTAFTFPPPTPLPSPIINLEDVDAGYEKDKPILRKLNLRIDQDDRIALLGANGNGKSTLVKLLSGRLAPLKGVVEKASRLKVGYFAQHQTEELDINQTPYELLQDAMKGIHESKVRASLGKFGFDKHKADTKVAELSGGEKARLLFCLMSFDAPHLMLLDEPTNHLDIDAREALQQALNAYDGAVILVSHDPHLVEFVADRLWLVANGGCTPYEGDLEEYRNLIISQRRKERADAKAEVKEKKSSKGSSSNSRVEKDMQKLEKQIAELNTQQKQIENEMEELSQKGDGRHLKDQIEALAKINKKLEESEKKWLELQEKLETDD